MKDFWEQRYKGSEYIYGKEPNEFLRGQAQILRPGQRALAVADGEGRNSVWLATKGLHVVAVDWSQQGLNKANKLASENKVLITTICADLLSWDWPQETFDIVVATYAHFAPQQRKWIHQRIWAALKPGGFFVLEAFSKEQLHYNSGGPPNKNLLYSKEMVKQDFANGEFRVLEERVIELNEGAYHKGPGAVVRALVHKPELS